MPYVACDPGIRTQQIVKQESKDEIKSKAILFTDKWFANRPTKVDYIPPEDYNPSPEFKTITEKKLKLKKAARDKIGLIQENDVKDMTKGPKYEYVHNPPVSSYSEFKSARKKKIV